MFKKKYKIKKRKRTKNKMYIFIIFALSLILVSYAYASLSDNLYINLKSNILSKKDDDNDSLSTYYWKINGEPWPRINSKFMCVSIRILYN